MDSDRSRPIPAFKRAMPSAFTDVRLGPLIGRGAYGRVGDCCALLPWLLLQCPALPATHSLVAWTSAARACAGRHGQSLRLCSSTCVRLCVAWMLACGGSPVPERTPPPPLPRRRSYRRCTAAAGTVPRWPSR
jgi:hypothetical protein